MSSPGTRRFLPIRNIAQLVLQRISAFQDSLIRRIQPGGCGRWLDSGTLGDTEKDCTWSEEQNYQINKDKEVKGGAGIRVRFCVSATGIGTGHLEVKQERKMQL